jgi:hypothetical protein
MPSLAAASDSVMFSIIMQLAEPPVLLFIGLQVSLVINYDLPNNRELYIHRIGRSGRFGRKGVAINFVKSDDIKILRDIEQFYSTQVGGGGIAAQQQAKKAHILCTQPLPNGTFLVSCALVTSSSSTAHTLVWWCGLLLVSCTLLIEQFYSTQVGGVAHTSCARTAAQ